MRALRRLAAVIVLVAASLSAVVLLPTAASAGTCATEPAQSSLIEDVPWAQSTYDAPKTIWPYSTGAGITVAVIGSGVDGQDPQLAGRVLPGVDLVAGSGGGDFDCVPNGTVLASIIAAGQRTGIGFYGLAPGVTILPVRVTEKVLVDSAKDVVDSTKVAAGIDVAVASGAQVIDVGVVMYRPTGDVEQAVARARAAGVVVVAPVGDAHETKRDGENPTDPRFTPYPASYDGVLGVGAIGADGQRLSKSQIGNYVDLVAPGGDITAAGSFGGQDVYTGTAFAAAFVCAGAALVLGSPTSGLSALTGAARADAVVDRLLATASPAAGGAGYGAGVLDPNRALVETVTEVPPVQPGDRATPSADLAQKASDDRRTGLGSDAFRVVLIALGVVLALVVGALVVPRGRRRRWRAGKEAARAPTVTDDEGPEYIPGEALFRPSVPD